MFSNVSHREMDYLLCVIRCVIVPGFCILICNFCAATATHGSILILDGPRSIKLHVKGKFELN